MATQENGCSLPWFFLWRKLRVSASWKHSFLLSIHCECCVTASVTNLQEGYSTVFCLPLCRLPSESNLACWIQTHTITQYKSVNERKCKTPKYLIYRLINRCTLLIPYWEILMIQQQVIYALHANSKYIVNIHINTRRKKKINTYNKIEYNLVSEKVWTQCDDLQNTKIPYLIKKSPQTHAVTSTTDSCLFSMWCVWGPRDHGIQYWFPALQRLYIDEYRDFFL